LFKFNIIFELMSLFSTELQFWFDQNHRDLPWRRTRNPYLIWLSEVILQQTRVQQGLSYYLNFAKNYPEISDLAKAPEQEVLNMWQGLGYYSRARNMLKTAQFINEHRGGIFPRTHRELLELPGVGSYTAAAIGSFAFDLPLAVVDGNVYRVLSRYFNIDEFIDTTSGQKMYQNLANELLDCKNPAAHNQAIMELGALICTPKNPDCGNCPLNLGCQARAEKNWVNLPRKKGKVKIRNRIFHYMVCQKNGALALCKRSGKDIWTNMYEFPMVEEINGVSVEFPVNPVKTVNHKLTHQNLTVHFYFIEKIEDLLLKQTLEWIKIDEIKKLPLPRVIEKFIAEELNLDTK